MSTPDAITRQWMRGPADKHAVAAGCYFDLDKAEYVRRFFHEILRIAPSQAECERCLLAGEPKPEAVPFKLLDWEWRDLIAPLFGWRRADGKRRFRRGYVSMAKKNGKSAIGSGLALYMICADGEADAEAYSFASDREQASLIYREAAKMVDASGDLQQVCHSLDYRKRINGPRRSFFQSSSSEARSKEGLHGHLILYDELHAARSRDLFDALRYAGAARSEPLMLTLTTAGDGANPAHICREQYEYAQGIIRGEILDPGFFALIYEAPAGCELDDPEAWKIANPSLGETILVDDLASAAEEAKASPAKESSFRRYRLNQWVSNATAWLSDALWDGCPADVEEPELAGQTCYAGLDLSSTDDLTAFVAIFPDADGDGVRLVSRFFLPEENVDRLERKHRVPYAAWIRSGHLILTPGNVVDYDDVRRVIREFATIHPVVHLGLDRGWQGQAMETALIEEGFDVVPVGAGWVSQDKPLKEIEKLVKSRRLRHDGNPVMRWNALNAICKTDDAGNYSLSKKLSRSKVDGVAALVNAIHCWTFATPSEPQAHNYYAANPQLLTLDW